jgi:hypothetical protein
MSNKDYKQKIIEAGIFPSPEMVAAIKEKHKNMVTKALVLAVFKGITSKTKKTS